MNLDIPPMTRLGAIDIVSLQPLEIYAALVHLAGHRDPVVAEAVVDAVQRVLERTRP